MTIAAKPNTALPVMPPAAATRLTAGPRRRSRYLLNDAADVSSLDQLVSEDGIFDLAPAEIAALRLGLLAQAVRWHLHPAAPYAGYARRQGFDPDLLATPAGLDRLPLLPSMLLKRRGVSVVHPEVDDVLWTTSSGTKGSISQIPRCDATLRRFFAGIGNLTNEMLGLENPSLFVLNFGPDAEEARNLWISYVMAGVTVLLPRSENYVRGGVLRIEQALCDLRQHRAERVAVIGPPPLLLELANAIAARKLDIALTSDSFVVTIGGWKRRSGEQLPREQFGEALHRAFGVAPIQVRDTFNMVELNTVLIECAEHKLHVPPWLYARARDCQTLDVVPSGQSGVLSYLDPTAVSYPGFVLSDDLGTVQEELACACGRRSDVLRIERRLNTMESRGCALKMDGIRVG
jgi:long-chain-fatty-acid---luciferin-component ligase